MGNVQAMDHMEEWRTFAREKQEKFLRICRSVSAQIAHWWLHVRFLLNPGNPLFEQLECVICADSRWRCFFFALHCEHLFCKECLRRFVESQVDAGQAVDIKCPMSHACGETVYQHELRRICEDADELWEQLERVQLQQSLRSMPDLYQCPSPDCANAVVLPDEKKKERRRTGVLSFFFGPKYEVNEKGADCRKFSCTACLYQHCLLCKKKWTKGHISHEDISCASYGKKTSGFDEQAESKEWIHAHTRECPRCRVDIEKNAGCQHMKCRACSYHFCWECLEHFPSYSHRCDAKKRAEVARRYTARRRKRRNSGGGGFWRAIAFWLR